MTPPKGLKITWLSQKEKAKEMKENFQVDNVIEVAQGAAGKNHSERSHRALHVPLGQGNWEAFGRQGTERQTGKTNTSGLVEKVYAENMVPKTRKRQYVDGYYHIETGCSGS